MTRQSGYEVIRFTEQGGHTRVTMDFQNGQLLFSFLKENRVIKKSLLYHWIGTLVKQICMFHNRRTNQCYRYLSPRSILVSSEETLYLLDLEAESNGNILGGKEGQKMRQLFMKKEQNFHLQHKIEADLYSLGRTLQFILAHVTVEPKLSRKEERRIHQFIQKCLGNHPRKSYHSLDKILKEIPQEHIENKRLRKIMCGIAGVLTIVFCMSFIFEDTPKEEMARVDSKKDYEKELEENIPFNSPKEESKDRLIQLKESLQNHTMRDNQAVIKQGEFLMLELAEYLATAFDREEQYEEALYYYHILIDREKNRQKLERIYLRTVTLEEERGGYEQARNIYQKAMQEEHTFISVAERYCKFICEIEEDPVEKKEEELSKLLSTIPELKEDTEFLKMQLEYGIKLEGEKVWIKKEKESS